MATQTPLNVPIRPWVPRWLGIVTAFTVMLPIILINGAYTGTITEVSGTLGVLSEDISMAYYATSAGMAVAYPLIPKVRPVVTTKTILLIDLLLQVILSFICAQVNQMDIIIVCSFFIGFLKGFAMLEIILMIRPLFSPQNVRSEFYAYFYPIVFSAGLDGGHGTVGLLLPMAVYVLLRYPALAGCHLFYPDVLPVCQASCLFSF